MTTRMVVVACLGLASMGVAGSAQEKLTLTTPVATANVTDYSPRYLGLGVSPASVVVELKPNIATLPSITCSYGGLANGKGLTCSNGFTSTTAPSGFATTQAMVVAWNKKNLSTANNSLNATVLNQLIADGAFVGTVTGSPQ